MATKAFKISSQRLLVLPMTDEELEETIKNEPDEEMKIAYGEMLEGCKKHPADRLWYTAWKMCLKKTPEVVVGDLCFKGPAVNGAVEIGYGVYEGHRGQGYTVEAANELINWAFLQKDVFAVDLEIEPSNEASKRVAQHLSFEKYGVGEEGERYRRFKPAPTYGLMGLLFGIGIGSGLGYAFGDFFLLGSLGGIALGFLLGTLFDKRELKHRKEVMYPESEK